MIRNKGKKGTWLGDKGGQEESMFMSPAFEFERMVQYPRIVTDFRVAVEGTVLSQ